MQNIYSNFQNCFQWKRKNTNLFLHLSLFQLIKINRIEFWEDRYPVFTLS